MCEIKNPYLQWDMGHGWPVWPEKKSTAIKEVNYARCISKINLNGTTYDIKDLTARDNIATYDKFYVNTNTGRRNGATEGMLTLVVPEIERVIFNEPATIVFWSDNTKTVVKCMEGELFDEEKGIAMAFMKKLYGKGYMNKIRRHISWKL